jgi:hypothetical protein
MNSNRFFSHLHQDHVKLVEVCFLLLQDFRVWASLDDQPNDVLLDSLALVSRQDLPSGLDHALKDLESVILGLLVVGKLENGVNLKKNWDKNRLGAIQIIRDTLGGRGGSKNVTGWFLLVISQVKIDKTCHMGGGGLKIVEKVSRFIWMAPNW